MQEVKKIVVIGPESTGKSSLCTLLADHYGTVWCPEYAREYLHENGAEYSYDDLLTIAKGHVKLESEYCSKADEIWKTAGKTPQPILFVDTDMYVMKVWCEYVFGKVHPYITDQIAASQRDLYLLCNIDLPWVQDELREYPDLESRAELFNIYKEILEHQPVRYITISGGYEQRLKTAISAVNNIIYHHLKP